MPQPETLKNNAYHARLVLLVASLLYVVYLFTFTSTFKTDDERLLIDAANSLVLQRSSYTSQTINVWGLRPVDTELAQPLLATPLYWLAYHLPSVGNIHAIFLFNLIITVITACLLFYYALGLGYGTKTALIGALLFGLTTIAWPYAQTFFREPLAGLMLLGSAFALDKWRRTFVAGTGSHWKWLLVGAAISIGALLSKEALLIAVPSLLALAYPGYQPFKKNWRTLAILTAGLALVLIVLVVILFTLREQTGLSASRYRISAQLGVLLQGLPTAWEGLAGFLISPGKGIWWYSPVLLLALGAPFVLPWSRWRESWLPLLLLVWFAFVYAAIKGPMWAGGASWGPRFMVPLTPLLMLAAVPLIDRILNGTHHWPKIALALLSLCGLLVQIGGNYVNLYQYYAQIEAGTYHFVWEAPAIWSFRWSQAIGSLLFMPQANTDIVWFIPSPNLVMIGVLSGGVALLFAAVIWLLQRPERSSRVQTSIAVAGPLMTIIITVIAFRFIYGDSRYQRDIPELESLRVYLAENASDQDIIMLSTPAYSPYFLNWYKGKPIWYNLPYSPGERSSWEQQPAVVSDKVEDLVSPISVQVFTGVLPGGALHRGGSLWLVADNGPFHPWATRPPEWYLAKYTYMVGVTEFSPTVRLIEYLPLLAPDASIIPEHKVDATFGQEIHLHGYDITLSTAEKSSDQSDTLAISLLWEAAAPIPIDYTVGVYLLDPAGALTMQQDRWPVDGFAPTSKWKTGQRTRDNYGFVLPQNMPPGRYTLAVAVYDWTSMKRLPIVGSDSTEQGDLLILQTMSID